jgi:hypothetical protein
MPLCSQDCRIVALPQGVETGDGGEMVPLGGERTLDIEGSAMPHYLQCGKIGVHWEPHFQCAGARSVTAERALFFFCNSIISHG